MGGIFNIAEFLLKQKEGLLYLAYPLAINEKSLWCAFSSRQGGVSRGQFSALNMGYHVGDETDLVSENRRRFFSVWNIVPEQVFSAGQTHGNEVAVIDEINIGKWQQTDNLIPGCDALVTGLPGLALAAYVADCYILYLFDYKNDVMAIAHAGWRGVLTNIAGSVINALITNFASRPENIVAAISPGICFSCFAVDEDVAGMFIGQGWHDDACCRKKEGEQKYLLNLSEILCRQLKNYGLLNSAIHQTRMCTCCNPHLFFSHRRDSGNTGRMMGIIGFGVK